MDRLNRYVIIFFSALAVLRSFLSERTSEPPERTEEGHGKASRAEFPLRDKGKAGILAGMWAADFAPANWGAIQS